VTALWQETRCLLNQRGKLQWHQLIEPDCVKWSRSRYSCVRELAVPIRAMNGLKPGRGVVGVSLSSTPNDDNAESALTHVVASVVLHSIRNLNVVLNVTSELLSTPVAWLTRGRKTRRIWVPWLPSPKTACQRLFLPFPQISQILTATPWS